MIQAIIFDCFGVLTTEGWIAFKKQHFGADPAKMQRASELSRMLDLGMISYDESLQEIAEMADVTVESLNSTLKDLTANKQLLDYIGDELKPTYKIAMLSNVGDDWLYTLFTKDQLVLFDAKSLSYEVGVIKPDPRAFELAADRLSLPTEECLFVDDLERNVTGAKVTGMQALLYRDFEQFKADLEQLLADPK